MKLFSKSCMLVVVVIAALLGTGVAVAEPGQIGLNAVASAEPISVSGSVVRMLGGLFLCIGAFAGGIHLYRKFLLKGPIGSGRRLEILERVAVSQKGSVALVSLDGREFLITAGADSPRIVPVSAARGDSFAESLGADCSEQELFNA